MLTTSAFETFLGPARVERGRTLEAPSAGLEDDERLSQSVLTFIEQHPFPPALQARIVKAFAELAERTELGERLSTAIRSSGVSEDGADASFAGQYDTYLGLRSAESVLECVRKCWSSNWGFGQNVVSGLVSPDHFSGPAVGWGHPGGADRG